MSPEERRDYYRTHRRAMRAVGFRRVSVTLGAEEYARLKQDATRHQSQPTAHLKSLAFAQLDTEYLVPPDQGERLDALIAILRGVGNNLNQLARHANEMRMFLDTDDVRRKVRFLEDEVTRFISEPRAVSKDHAGGGTTSTP
jgi:hypothetical protein